MNKKILSLVLVLTLVLGSFSFAFADTKVSSDVVGTEYEDAVARLGKLSILTGYPDGTFKPNNTITRAEFATAVSRARGLEAAAQNSKGDTTFTDVPASHWASGYVNQASKLGLVNGMGNGIFAPEAQITYEQAVTLVVRALGYEEAAKSKGGYPYGHLAVASSEGLLDGVKGGTQGSPATRGLVAQLLDNALDIPMMIQVGYGDSAKWVKSGTEWTEEKFLFDELGLERLVKATIKSADKDKNKIVVEGKKNKNDSDKDIKARTLKVGSDFNFAGLEGLRVTAWYDKDDNLIDIKLDNDYTVKFDALEVTKVISESKDEYKGELKLITEDKKYDVSKDVVFKGTIDKDLEDSRDDEISKGKKYNFAKIILDEYNDISLVEAYNLDEKIVVEKLEKDILKGYDSQDIDDIDDFTIIKDDKQIRPEDLSKGDVLLFNDKDEYAVVLTITKEGEIKTVYEKGFKFDNNKNYDLDTDEYGRVQYLNGEDVDDVDGDVLKEMKDGGKVTLYFSFDEKVVFIDGKAEQISSSYAMVKEDSLPDTIRNKTYYNVEVLNSEGKVVKYDDIEEKDIADDIFDGTLAEYKETMKKGNIIKINVDSSNEVTKIEAVKSKEINSKIDLDNNIIGGFKSQNKAVVFWKDGESKIKDYEVLTLDKAVKEFTEVTKGVAYGDKDGRLVAVFAETTNNETRTDSKLGIVRSIEKLKDKDKYEVELEINGKDENYYEAKSDDFKNLKKNEVVILEVTKDGKEAKSWSKPDTKVITVDKAQSRRITDNQGNTYNVEGKYYEEGKFELNDIETSDVKKGDKVTLYFEAGSKGYGNNVGLVLLGERASDNSELDQAKKDLNTRLDELKALELNADKYTAESIKAVEDAIAKLEAASKYTDAKAINDAVASVKDVKLVEKEEVSDVINGKLADGIFAPELTFDVTDGSKVTEVTINGTELSTSEFEYGVDGNTVTVIDVKSGDVVKVVVDGTEYTVKF